jgi:hypothetical protein
MGFLIDSHRAACAFPLYSSTVLEAELLEVLEVRFDWEPVRLTNLRQRLARLWTLGAPTIKGRDRLSRS